MKDFRTYNQAKKDLHAYTRYVQLIEQYEPESLLQHAIKIYALEGNLSRTAEQLNQLQFTIDDRPIESKDVTALILSKPSPQDDLHKEIKRLYKKKTYSLRHR